MNVFRHATLIIAAFVLGACSGLKSHQPAPEVYVLRARPVPAAPRTVEATLVIARPSARPGLDGDRIAVTMADRRVDAYAGGRWSAALPRVVESLLLDGFRGAGGFKAVLTERGAFTGRYLLQVEVTEFAADYRGQGGPPVARVALRGELGVSGTRQLLASVSGSAAVPATADRQREVAAAFEAAYATAAEQLIAAVDAAALADAAAPRP